MKLITTLAASLLLTTMLAAETVTIDFGTERSTLQYTEHGLTISEISTGGLISESRGENVLQIFGTLEGEGRIAVTAETPFDLHSLDLTLSDLTTSRFGPASFTIATDVGGEVIFTSNYSGTVDFTDESGFTSIRRFEFVTNDVFNDLIAVDNITLRFVPEPTSLSLLLASVLLFGRRHIGSGTKHSWRW